MLCSVIIPFHNEIELISRAVNSVRVNFATGLEFEIVIGNDGNIPNHQILDKIDCSMRPYVLIVNNLGNRGPGGARNVALDAANGDVIAFLDSDDYWLPGKIADQICCVKSGATFVVTSYFIDCTRSLVPPPNSIDKPTDIFLKRGIGTSTVLLTRNLLARRRFRDIRFSQDIDFWYLLSNSNDFIYCSTQRPGTVYSSGGSTKNKWSQLLSLQSVMRLNKIPRSIFFKVILSYSLAGLYKHYYIRYFNKFFKKKNSDG